MGGYCSSCMFSRKTLLILDYAVSRNDGSAYPKSAGFQPNPLVKMACTVDNGRCKANAINHVLEIILKSHPMTVDLTVLFG